MKAMKLRHLIPATLAGMVLRLFFIAWFPFVAADTELYRELARNLIEGGVYGIYAGDALVPADMRMPGYPLFLAGVETLLGPGDERVMVVQAGLDVLTCLVIAWLAAKLNPRAGPIALWLAMLCPFTANYCSTLLTEPLALLLTALSLLVLCEEHGFWMTTAGAALVGLATMVRPESPLLLPAVGLALLWRLRHAAFGKSLWPLTRSALALAAGLLAVLAPWGYRNWVQVGYFTMVSNPDAATPWEHGLKGYDDWARTWLVSVNETVLFGFTYEEEEMDPAQLPGRAYDSEAERVETVRLIQRYNVFKRTPPDLNWDFEQLARRRAARNPFRQYVTIPALRALHFWFTPRIQLLPFSGEWRPIKQAWQDDWRDFTVTMGYFLLNIFYVAAGLYGAWKFRRELPALVMFLFILIRTLFMTQHNTIEPRYMLLCYPALIALGAAGLARQFTRQCDTKAA